MYPVSFIREPYHHRNVRVPLCLSFGHTTIMEVFWASLNLYMVTQSSKSFNTCIPVSFIREPYHHRNVRVPLCLSFGHPTIMEVFWASLKLYMVTQSSKSFNACIPVSFIRKPYHHRNVRVPLCLSFGHTTIMEVFWASLNLYMVTQSSKLFNTCIPVSFIREPYHHRNVRVPLCLSFGHPTIMEVFWASLKLYMVTQSSKSFNTCIPVSFIRKPYHPRNVRVPLCLSFGHPTIMEVFWASLNLYMVTQSSKSFNTCIPVSFIRKPYHHRNVRVSLCLSFGHTTIMEVFWASLNLYMVTQSSKSFNTCTPVSFIREPYHHRNVRVPLCLSFGHPTIMEVFWASLNLYMVTQSSKSFNSCIPISFIREPYHHRNVRVSLCLSYEHPTIMEVFWASLNFYMVTQSSKSFNTCIPVSFIREPYHHRNVRVPLYLSYEHPTIMEVFWASLNLYMVTQSSKSFNTCIPVSFIRKPYHHRNVRVPLCLSFGHPTIMEVFWASLNLYMVTQSSKSFNTCIPVSFIREPYHHRDVRVPLCLSYGNSSVKIVLTPFIRCACTMGATAGKLQVLREICSKRVRLWHDRSHDSWTRPITKWYDFGRLSFALFERVNNRLSRDFR